MTKQAERQYLVLLGEEGRVHARDKPFSDESCGLLLCDIGTIMNLLPPRPARVLELGCGGGWFSCMLARHGYRVVGVDISEAMVALAQENRRTQGLDNAAFLQGDYESLSFADEFDAVVFYDSLHHSESEHAALAAAYRALKPGGILITHEPGEGHSKSPDSIRAMERFGVSERDMPPHQIIKVARRIGFSRPRVLPMPLALNLVIYKQTSTSKLLNSAIMAARLLKMLFHKAETRSAITVLTK